MFYDWKEFNLESLLLVDQPWSYDDLILASRWAQLFKTNDVVYVSLKFWSSNMTYMLIFLLKKKCE